MRDLGNVKTVSRRLHRQTGFLDYDPLGDALNRLAETEQEKIAEIVRREISKQPAKRTVNSK
jgi:hypothetical protein